MANLPKTVTLTGEVAGIPEIRATVNGVYTATFSLNTTTRNRNRAGVYVTRLKRHRIVAHKDTALAVRNAVRKGTHMTVEGKVELKTWQVKTTGETKHISQIVIDRLTFVDPMQPQLTLVA